MEHPTDRLINLSLGLDVEKNKEVDYFVRRRIIPLGVRHHPDNYKDEIPEEELVYIQVPYNFTSNPLNIAYIEQSGKRKTQLAKNIVLGLQKLNYNILTIEAKSRDWYYSRYQGNGKFLHQNMENTKMKCVNYVPSFLYSEVPKDQRHNYKYFSPNLKRFKTEEDWFNLGGSELASSKISSFMMKNEDKQISLKDIKSELGKYKTLLAEGTKRSGLSLIENLENSNFFTYPKIPYLKEWKEGNNIIVSLFAQYGAKINVIVNKLIQDVNAIGQWERNINPKNISGKFIVFEDSSFYATNDDSYVTKEIRNVQNNMRSYGVNSLLIIQLPDLIEDLTIDSASVKLVGNINNPYAIQPHIPRKAYEILKDEELFIDEDNFIFEKMLIQGSRVERFFMFDCLTGFIT